jgi:prolyl oligopeptidase
MLAPGPRQSIDQAVVTDHRIVAVVYDNVRGSLVSISHNGEWGPEPPSCRSSTTPPFR